MANVAQLIRRQSSRELLRVPLDRLELREMQHRLLPAAGDQPAGSLPLYGAANAGYVDEGNASNQQVIQSRTNSFRSVFPFPLVFQIDRWEGLFDVWKRRGDSLE